MADQKNPTPTGAGLTESIINEGKKVAQAGQISPAKGVDQNEVKAQAIAASQPAQPAAQPAQAFASENTFSATSAEFAEFQKWKQSQTQPATTQAAPQAQTADLEKEYGAGFVTAKRGAVTQHFTAKTWRALGGDQNRDGYKRAVSTPPEVANLKK